MSAKFKLGMLLLTTIFISCSNQEVSDSQFKDTVKKPVKPLSIIGKVVKFRTDFVVKATESVSQLYIFEDSGSQCYITIPASDSEETIHSVDFDYKIIGITANTHTMRTADHEIILKNFPSNKKTNFRLFCTHSSSRANNYKDIPQVDQYSDVFQYRDYPSYQFKDSSVPLRMRWSCEWYEKFGDWKRRFVFFSETYHQTMANGKKECAKELSPCIFEKCTAFR